MQRLFILGLFILPVPMASGIEFSYMTYNVENLFDETHDPRKDDWTFLPLEQKQTREHKERCLYKSSPRRRMECLSLNWDEQAVKNKIKGLREEILALSGPEGPDILALVEVENKPILNRLQASLNIPQYRPGILIEDKDPRGIDVALISKFAILEPPKIIPVPAKPGSKKSLSRGFLQVHLNIGGGHSLKLYVLHLPAPYHPIQKRTSALLHLNHLLTVPRSNKTLLMASGDFNIVAAEDAKLYRALLAPLWHVSHLTGCHTCRGSYYYGTNKTWSFLDAILLARQQSCHLIPDSIKLGKVSSASDHRPLIARVACPLALTQKK